MVAAEAGEHRGVDAHRLEPALVERVGRRLHGQHAEPGVPQLRHPAVDLDRARRGEPRRLEAPRPAGAQRAHQRAPVAAGLRREVGDAGLAVRPGDRGDGQRPGRLAVETRGSAPDRAHDVGDGDDGGPPDEPRRHGVPLDDDGAGSGGDRVGDEAARVETPAPAGEEQGAGHDLAAVVAYRRHRPVQRGGDRSVFVEECRKPRSGGHHVRRHVHGVPSGDRIRDADATLIAARRTVAGESGAIPSTRNEPSTTSENTGAATVPP